MDRICKKVWAEKEEAETLRTWRYYLNLQSGWKRIVWAGIAVCLAIYGCVQMVPAIGAGARQGFAASISSQVYTAGRYGRWVDYTLPIYYDVIYSTLLMVAGTVMMVVLCRVSRGASQWEELDDTRSNKGSW